MEQGWAAIISSMMGLVGVLAGAWIVNLNQRRSDERRAADNRTAAEGERNAQLEDKRHEVQLATLTELQEALRQKTRATILIVEHDRRTFEERGAFFQLGESQNREDYEAGITYSHLTARVLDTELRAQLTRFNSLCAECSLPPVAAALPSEHVLAELQHRRRALADAGSALTDALGDALRLELSHEGRKVEAHSRSVQPRSG